MNLLRFWRSLTVTVVVAKAYYLWLKENAFQNANHDLNASKAIAHELLTRDWHARVALTRKEEDEFSVLETNCRIMSYRANDG